MAALCACAMPRVERVLQAHCQQHFNAGMFYDFLSPHPSTSPRPGVFSTDSTPVLWMFHIISIMAEQIKDSWDVHASILSPAVFTSLFVNDTVSCDISCQICSDEWTVHFKLRCFCHRTDTLFLTVLHKPIERHLLKCSQMKRVRARVWK